MDESRYEPIKYKLDAGMGKERDETVPYFFAPVPLVPRDNHAKQSREFFCPSPEWTVALSPGPDPGDLRDWNRDLNIVPGRPPIFGFEEGLRRVSIYQIYHEMNIILSSIK